MPDKKLFCSFCQQSQDDVTVLLAGPDIFICDGCVAELMAIIAEKESGRRNVQIERLSKIGQLKE